MLVVFYLYLNKKFCFTATGAFPCCDKPLKEKKSSTTAAKELGTAFSYEEVESSTDSEDEVLQRLQNSTSNHHGLRRHCSRDTETDLVEKSLALVDHCGAVVTGQEHRGTHGDLISLAEKGRIGKRSSASSSSSETSHRNSGEDATSKAASSNAGTVQQQHHFENAAFQNLDEAASSHQVSSPYQEQEGMDQDEHLFDVTDLQNRMNEPDSSTSTRCGILEVSFTYDKGQRKMTVHIIQAQDLPSRDRGGASNVQVRLLLLPHKRQKHKTKIRSGNNPEFNETFVLNRIAPEEIDSMGIRFRLYSCERMRREHLIGESVVSFGNIHLEQQVVLLLTLDPRSNITHSDSKTDLLSLTRSDSTGSTHSMQHGGLPELLLGLAYNGTTGRLSVEVIKGSHFRNVTMNRAPDTYVKLSLVSSSGQEIARSKTSVRRGQPNPLFKETFVFQVALFQLPDVTLMVAIYNKRSMKRKEMIGWFSLGLNSSGEEELSHWNDMRENKGEQVCRWHVLLET